VSDSTRAALTLKIFNCEFVFFDRGHCPKENCAKSSIHKELKACSSQWDIDFSQNELSNNPNDEQDEDLISPIAVTENA
jgi:hypothetical protein